MNLYIKLDYKFYLDLPTIYVPCFFKIAAIAIAKAILATNIAFPATAATPCNNP